MKRIVALMLALVFALAIAGCVGSNRVTKDNVERNSVYSVELGVGIRLGMDKADIDELLGQPDKYDNYCDGLLSVSYEDRKVVFIHTSDEGFITYKKIGVGSSRDSVYGVFGENEAEKDDKGGASDGALYSFDMNHKRVSSSSDAGAYTIFFVFENDEVSSFAMIDNNAESGASTNRPAN